MADDTNTAERDAFEAWCVTQGWVEKPSARPNGTYINGSLQARWLGWIGRASLAASAGSEPVAWRDPSNMCDDQSFTLSRERAKKWPHIYKQPLYTHPSPPEGMAGWKPIATAPKDGTLILVHFKSKGVRAVSWDSPFHDEVTEENGIWCVDDDKHGPYGLRGYNDDDGPTAPTHWMPLPAPPLHASEAKEL